MKMPNELRSGLFVVISLALLATLIFVMGRERQIFAKQASFVTTFKDVKGLSVGAPVRLGGITIGRVARVAFSQNLEDFRIFVEISINEDFLDRIHVDSQVMIETQGLLGDRFVSVGFGQGAPLAQPGATLPSADAADFTAVLAKAQNVADNVVSISESVKSSLAGIEPESFAKLGEAFGQLNDLLSDVQKQDGLIHRLIYSEKDANQILDSLGDIATDVRAVVREAKSGSGILHALLFEPKGIETVQGLAKAVGQVGNAAESVQLLTTQAHEGRGLLHDILYTPVEPGAFTTRIESTLSKLESTANNLEAVSSALSKGSGSLGALIVDPRVYDNLVEITDGARRSFVLRQAIRSSLAAE
jgi:phospholipid/cholesterol/gamma-HCH transport system substrate-binding protein